MTECQKMQPLYDLRNSEKLYTVQFGCDTEQEIRKMLKDYIAKQQRNLTVEAALKETGKTRLFKEMWLVWLGNPQKPTYVCLIVIINKRVLLRTKIYKLIQKHKQDKLLNLLRQALLMRDLLCKKQSKYSRRRYKTR